MLSALFQCIGPIADTRYSLHARLMIPADGTSQ